MSGCAFKGAGADRAGVAGAEQVLQVRAHSGRWEFDIGRYAVGVQGQQKEVGDSKKRSPEHHMILCVHK